MLCYVFYKSLKRLLVRTSLQSTIGGIIISCKASSVSYFSHSRWLGIPQAFSWRFNGRSSRSDIYNML